MFVYVKNGKIILQTEKRYLGGITTGAMEYEIQTEKTDKLIYEDNQIKKYEDSNQYIEDTNYYHIHKELQEEKKKNQELQMIVDNKVKEELELEKKKQETDNYQQKLYILKNLKW